MVAVVDILACVAEVDGIVGAFVEGDAVQPLVVVDAEGKHIVVVVLAAVGK